MNKKSTVSYRKLWHILIDKGMKKKDLAEAANLTHYQMTKLANDKATIDSHTRQIEALNKRTDTQDTGIRALCHGMLALLDNAERCGNGCKEITEAKKSFTDYLADK